MNSQHIIEHRAILVGTFFFGWLAFGLAVLLAIVFAISVRNLGRLVSNLSNHCDQQWGELKGHLVNRHLIISHLVDALPPSNQNKYLRDSSAEASDALKRLDTETATSQQYSDIAISQRQFQWQLHDVLTSIDKDSPLRKQTAIASCLDGLQKVDREIKQAKSGYNTAACAFIAASDWRVTRLLTLLGHRHRTYRDIEFGWPSGDSDEPSGIDTEAN